MSCYSFISLTLLHSERPKLYAILVFLSAIQLNRVKGGCTRCSAISVDSDLELHVSVFFLKEGALKDRTSLPGGGGGRGEVCFPAHR